MNTQELNPSVNNGITMEVPYKCFQTPPVFWNLIKRNILPGIPTKLITFDKEGAVETLGAVISVLNNFTDRAAFNAQGLLKDDMEPSDDVYQQWAKTLKFYLTVTEQVPGGLKFSIGVQETNPWTGVQVQEIGSFTAKFFMDVEGFYNFLPSVTPEFLSPFLKEGEQSVGVAPYVFWNSGGDLAPGLIPSMLTEKDLVTQLNSFVDEICEKLSKENVFENRDKLVFKLKLDPTTLGLENQIIAFSSWSGGDLFMSTASLYARKIPFKGTEGSNSFRIHIVMTARGNFEMNYYANSIIFNS